MLLCVSISKILTVARNKIVLVEPEADYVSSLRPKKNYAELLRYHFVKMGNLALLNIVQRASEE